MDLELLQYLLVAIAALAGGMVNALAGGGTLITFPMLTAVGLPAVAANVTNTVALLPGYLGATFAQAKDLKGQEKRLWIFIPAALVGGAAGGLLLLNTGEKLFRDLIPYLILMASALLAVADPVRAWVLKRSKQGGTNSTATGGVPIFAAVPVALAAVYGGYFGAGLSVIVLAVLGLVVDENLTRLNALKQFIAFTTNVAAAVFFVFSDQVEWKVAAVMAVGALLGGSLGGRLASKIKPRVLRMVVVVIGVVISIIYFIR